MEKRVVIGTSMVLLAIAIVGFVIYLVFYHEGNNNTWEYEDEEEVNVTALTPYGQSLAEPVTYEYWNATWEAILSSDAAYLQDPDFDVTADNFYQSVHDLLGLPARLYFYSTDDQIEGSYKCDDPEITVKFADVFQGLSLRECSEEEYYDKANNEYNTEISFWNVAGNLMIRCYQDYSFIGMHRYHKKTDSVTDDYFYVEENLHDKAMAAYEKLLPYSMEAPARETE
ncbi:MAG TPA: hypothetical protein PKD52_09055 [Clostridiales bacterium]|nr:hypothetical protein [Clostridiales bacterium]